MSMRNPFSEGRFSSDLMVIGYIAGIKLVLQLVAINGYGYFRDEFYYIACSNNLAFGYVDHPPLAMLLLRGIRELFGDSIFAGNYGEAGAVDLLGKKHGLPDAISSHNSYYLWGPHEYSGDIVIFIGGSQEELMQYFEEVVEAGQTDCGYCMPYENNQIIFLYRGIRGTIREIWPKIKSFN